MKTSYSSTTTKEQLWQLYSSLGWAEFLNLTAEKLFTAMQQSWYVVYAYQGDRLVGTGRVISDGVINAYLCGLGVDPAFRGQGLGTEISRLLLDKCNAHGLHTQFFCEEHMVPFYSKMGFSVFAVGMKAERS